MEAFCRKIQASLDYAENHVDVPEEKNVEPPDDPDMAQALAASNASMKLQEKEEDNIRRATAASLADNKEKQEERKTELQKEYEEELINDISIADIHGKYISKCNGFKFREIHNGKILILGAHPTEKHIQNMTKENKNTFKSETYTLSNWIDDNDRTASTDFFINADLNDHTKLMNISSVQSLQFNRIIMDWSVLKGCYATWIYENDDRDKIWNAIYNMLTDNGEIIIPRYFYLLKYDLSKTLIHQINNLKDSKIMSPDAAHNYRIKSITLQNMQRDNRIFDEFEEFIIKENKFHIKHCSVDHQKVKFPMQISVPNTANYANQQIKYFYVLIKK
jgi:hypothetical protein